MKRSRFTEEQIIGVLGERGRRRRCRALPQARDVVGDVLRLEGEVRRDGRVGGKRLRALEDENARLKRLYADAMLDNAGLKELVAKKW